MRAQLIFLAAFLVLTTPAIAGETSLEPTQNPNVTYRLFKTQNIYTFLRLDTRVGRIWQVQWGDDGHRFMQPLNTNALVSEGKIGRFTLYPTKNIYTFILLDQEAGNSWHVQWGESKDRFILPIKTDLEVPPDAP